MTQTCLPNARHLTSYTQIKARHPAVITRRAGCLTFIYQHVISLPQHSGALPLRLSLSTVRPAERHLHASAAQHTGQSFRVVYPSQPRITVPGSKRLIEKHHARTAIKHQVTGMYSPRPAAFHRQRRFKIMIFLVAVQIVHTYCKWHKGSKSPCRSVVGQRRNIRPATHGYVYSVVHNSIVYFIIITVSFICPSAVSTWRWLNCPGRRTVLLRTGCETACQTHHRKSDDKLYKILHIV